MILKLIVVLFVLHGFVIDHNQILLWYAFLLSTDVKKLNSHLLPFLLSLARDKVKLLEMKWSCADKGWSNH